MSAAAAAEPVVVRASNMAAGWEQIATVAARMAATMNSYLAELAKTVAPSSVNAAAATLRQFAGYVTVVDPNCTAVAAITGHHVGIYGAWLVLHPHPDTPRCESARTVNDTFAELRTFFERIVESGEVDTPTVIPVPARCARPSSPSPEQQQPPALRREVIDDGSLHPWRQRTADSSWEQIAIRAPQIAETMTAYLEQLTVSARPATVSAASLVLRQFAAHLTTTDTACVSVAAVERRHIESYKIALAARPGRNGTVTTETIRNNLGMLRTFFERVIDWDDPDAPRRVPVFASDLPKANEPLPKFLDDPAAAKFMATLAVEPNRRRRLIVELLAAPGCVPASWAGCAMTRCIASVTRTGCASRSASCTTNAPSPCTRCSSG